ncbi:hypothetical protein P9112_004691 [Eukaryota sp. TZLM1-RC]
MSCAFVLTSLTSVVLTIAQEITRVNVNPIHLFLLFNIVFCLLVAVLYLSCKCRSSSGFSSDALPLHVHMYLGMREISPNDYEILRSLDTTQTTLTPKEISTLPTFLASDANGEACCICLDHFNAKQKLLILPCDFGHVFHFKCISKALSFSSRCPICRTDIADVLQRNKYSLG